MKKILSIGLIMVVSFGFVACGGIGDTIGGGSSKNSLSLNSDNSSFTISLKSGITAGEGDDTHVAYEFRDSSGNRILSNGSNYKGSVTTLCTNSYSTGSSDAYSCSTHYDTNSPVGDPQDELQEITLSNGKTYSLYMMEYFLFKDTKETQIKSLSS